MPAKEIYKALDNYYEKFGDAFPLMEYDYNEKEAVAAINECIKKGKTIQQMNPRKKDAIY